MTSYVRSLKSLAAAIALMMPCVGFAADGAGNRGITDSVVTTIVGGHGEGATDATTSYLPNLNGGITRDSAGNIYYTEGHRILKQTGAALTVFGGQTVSGSAADGVKVTNTRFDTPTFLTTDPAGNIYVYDSGNNRIRKIDTNLIITTVAGNGGTAGATVADIGRVGTDARLPGNIVGIAANSAGDLFFADSGTNCIYKVAAADRRLSIVAGNGTAGGLRSGASAVNASLGNQVQSIAILANTVIYSTNGGVIRQLQADGTSVVIAGVLDTTVAAPGVDTVSQDALYPDDGTKDALQLITATVTAAQVGGIDPGPLAVDGSTIFFFDNTENRIRSFTPGGKIKTVFGEVSEKGQSEFTGFRIEGGVAAPNTPRLGLVLTSGPNAVIDAAIGGDDDHDTNTRPERVFAGPNGTSDTTAAGDDVQVVAPAGLVADDQTPRNDDPRCNIGSGQLVASGGVVTFIDQNNEVVRQFTVGGNVNTIAGTTNAIRLANGIQTTRHPKNSTNAAVPALGAGIDSPGQLARDSAGNLYFDALDVQGRRNIYKYDGAAKTIAVIAGRVITNGFPANVGDGGPAATAKITGLGTQVGTLADGTVLFADTVPPATGSSHTIRAVSPTGVLSTIAGIPGQPGNIAPDVDHVTINAAGNLVNPFTRVGQKATDVAINNPLAVTGTSLTDFLFCDASNNRLVVVQGGNVFADINVGIVPAYVVSLSPTVAVVASTAGQLRRVDYTAPAAPVIANAASVANVRGLAVGNIGVPVLFVLGTPNVVDLRDQTTLAQFYTVAPLTATLNTGGNLIGMVSDGTNLVFTNSNDVIQQVPIASFPNTAAGPAALSITPTALAGPSFASVDVNGFNVQVDFQFNAFAPVAMLGTSVLVGDDGVIQYRKVTLGATPPAGATASVIAGTGSERNGGADGGPATATNIGSVEGIAVDANGAVFFTDGTDVTVRKVAAGIVTTVAGIPGRSASNQPNNVPATESALNSSMGGLAFSPTGLLHIADTGNNIVRRINADGTIVTVAGIDEGFQGVGGEGSNPLAARLAGPHKIAFDANGDLYIGENTSIGRVHVVSKNNIITTVGGGGNDSLDYNPTSAFDVSINSAGLALDTAGKIYVADGSEHVSRISGGLAQVVVGDPLTSGFNGDGLPGNQTLLEVPKGLAFDPTLGLVICDQDNNRIRAVANLAEATNTPPTAIITTTPDHLGAAPLKVHFDGSQSLDADGDIVTWEWDFGDGTKGNGISVDHVYGATGSYTVTLTVTDTQGNTSSVKTVVFAAVQMVTSSTNGKGSFKVAAGPKATKPSDSFSLSVKNIDNLTNQVGKTAKIIIGSFSADAVVGGKGVKTTSKTTKLTIDPVKKTVTLSIKGVKLGTALAELGVKNENTVAPGKSVLIPVIVNVNNGALVVGDKFLFFYKFKFNSGGSGKFSQ